MTGVIATIPKYQFSSATGSPLVNGALDVYLAGTTTRTSTWQDQALTALNTNPVVLDDRGECVLWLDSTKNYKFVLKNSSGTMQWTQDNLTNSMASIAGLQSALAAPSGAGMIGFQSSPGRTVNQQLDMLYFGIANITDPQYAGGATGGANDTIAIQAAAASGKMVYAPAGTWNISSITTTGPGLIGDGPQRTRFVTLSATADVITWNGLGQIVYNGTLIGPRFEGFSVSNGLTPTAGSVIKIAPSLGEISACYFRDVWFFGLWNCIEFVAASHWVISGCKFLNQINCGVIVANENHPDSGDSTISQSTFNCGSAAGFRCGVYQKSSGGLRIVDCKFLGGAYHYYMGCTATNNVADLLIANNSLENAVVQSIVFTRLSGSAYWGSINIIGNQFGGNPTDILCADVSGFLSDVHIAANSFGQLGSSSTGISLAYINGFSISSNRFSGSNGASTGVAIASTSANGRINANSFLSVGTPYVNSSSSTIIDGHQRGTANVTTNSAYGSFFTGTYSITFPIAYDIGFSPNVTAAPSSGAGGGFSCFVSSETNLGATVTVIGLSNGGVVPITWRAN